MARGALSRSHAAPQWRRMPGRRAMKKMVLMTAGVAVLSFGWTLPAAQQPGRDSAPGRGAPEGARGGRGGGNQQKADNLPAGLFAAGRYSAMPTERHEWVDIPAGAAKLH